MHNPTVTEWMNATFLLANKIKMMMLLNVVQRKVHKNMSKKVHFWLASFAQKVVFGFPYMSWESLFYESNESTSYESSYERWVLKIRGD